jgi:hypothetical protein
MARIRNGFVSNSSSSSFCIIGIEINKPDEEKMKEIMTKVKFNWKNYSEDESVEDIFYGDFSYENKSGIVIKDSDSVDCHDKKIVVGYDLGSGDEYGCNKITMKQIKETEKKLQDFLDSKEEASIYAGVEYNG